MDSVSEARLQLVIPELGAAVHRGAEVLAAEGITVRVIMSGRSFSEQDGLFAKGRTVMSDVGCLHHGESKRRAPGSCSDHPLGATVTNARGGESWHNYFMAADLCPDDPTIPGYQPDWNSDSWDRIVKVMVSFGLYSGRSWNDLPHFQWTGRFPVSPTVKVKQLYLDQGIDAVWNAARLVKYATT
jgi:peptidoglycan L-alanyl-D-glutamate endopeptidase CwlK